jgi:hypothetical protein
VKSPHAIFNMPQRLLVPLFQRPYVWNEEKQWEPLWRDVERIANRLLSTSAVAPQPHFLGAVVFQQIPNPAGDFQTRTIIDGQQRLTTLQVMLDAFHAELLKVGAERAALRMQKLVRNDPEYCNHDEDQFKVWPTNRDRPAFYEVMSAPTPVDYASLKHRGERLPKAHHFFATQASSWLEAGSTPDEVTQRAEALERAARELLQIVVIDLTIDENAQEIFETLNSRGAQLSAADLIKNFVFQRLLDEGADTEDAYERYWKQFETSFWEKDVSQGRLVAPRSSWFLNHFLISRLGETITATEVFARFKHFALHQADIPMMKLLQEIHRAAAVYERIVMGATMSDSNLTRLDLFSYRTQAMDSDVIKPVLLYLLDPEQPPLAVPELNRALQALESWLVRRMIVRATTKGYNKTIADLVAELHRSARDQAADCVVGFLAGQTADANYWPDDDEVRQELSTLPMFRRLTRGRTRMLLEALEDHRRGWEAPKPPSAEQRVPRGTLTIEHLMPQTWEANWPLGPSETPASRNDVVHRLGNLTLLTQKLNSRVSNSGWVGEHGKHDAIRKQGTLLLNHDVLQHHADAWTAADIAERTNALTDSLLRIWPVPEGHSVRMKRSEPAPQVRLAVADLMDAGLFSAGTTLVFRGPRALGRKATVLADGRIEADDGSVWGTLSGAAKHVTGLGAANGWFYWAVESTNRRLTEYWSDYMNQYAVDADEPDSAMDE